MKKSINAPININDKVYIKSRINNNMIKYVITCIIKIKNL